jgi:ABC-type transport system involved in cytochrome c biogenesis permease subunit
LETVDVHLWLSFAAGLYAAGAVAQLASMVASRSWLETLALWIPRAAWIALTITLLKTIERIGGEWLWSGGMPAFALVSIWFASIAQMKFEVRGRLRGSALGVSVLGALGCMVVRLWFARDPFTFDLPEMHDLLTPVHATLGALGYGCAVLAGSLSFFQLLREQVQTDRLLMGASAVTIAVTPWILAADPEIPPSPLLKALATSAVILFGIHLVLSSIRWLSIRMLPRTSAGMWGSEGEEISTWTRNLRIIFTLGALLIALSAAVAIRAEELPILGRAALSFVALGCVFMPFLWAIRPRLESRLPSAANLDRWAYQAVRAAFLFTLACLLSGAWQAERYWSGFWDFEPKEVATLALLVELLMYLVARESERPSRRQVALLGCFGLVLTLLVFMGVASFRPGLHIYGAGI